MRKHTGHVVVRDLHWMIGLSLRNSSIALKEMEVLPHSHQGKMWCMGMIHSINPTRTSASCNTSHIRYVCRYCQTYGVLGHVKLG